MTAMEKRKFTRNRLVMMRSLATTLTAMFGIFHLSVVVVVDGKNLLQMVTIIVTSKSDERKSNSNGICMQ